MVRDLKDPPARLLDQARVRDGAFDIGMFRSYWERAARITGERIADLSARPMAAVGRGHATRPSCHGDAEPSRATRSTEHRTDEPLSHLSGLISRALESADQLAAVHPPDPEGDQG